jgi:hypothetical protein
MQTNLKGIQCRTKNATECISGQTRVWAFILQKTRLKDGRNTNLILNE